MRKAHNKIEVDSQKEKTIRSMFFKQAEMKEIEGKVGLKEQVIRRVINEHNWAKKRERYFRYLTSYAYTHDIPLVEISKKTGVKYYALCRIHKKYLIPKPKKMAWNDRRSEKIEKSIIKDYQSGLTGNEVAEKYGYKRRESVYQILEKNGIKRKPPKVYTHYNESFFEKIDGQDKAYILGLIMTDGYIIKNYDGFGIQLTEEDGYILEKIRDLVGGTNPISHIDCSNKRKVMPNTKDMSRLHVFSKKIGMDLKNLGVVRRKTKTLRYVGCVPKKYLSHFFRGLIDGDGTVGTAKNKNIWCQLVSASKGFLKDLLLTINLSLPFCFKIGVCTTNRFGRSFKIYVLRIVGGNKGTIKFLKWLYNDRGDLYLRRKYAKVQNYIG